MLLLVAPLDLADLDLELGGIPFSLNDLSSFATRSYCWALRLTSISDRGVSRPRPAG